MLKVFKNALKRILYTKHLVIRRKNHSSMQFRKMIVILMLIISSISVILPTTPAPPLLLQQSMSIVDRDLMWNRYLKDDGSYMVEIGSSPLNYNDSGVWKPINEEFVLLDGSHPAFQYGYTAGCEKGLFNVYLKQNAQSNYPIAFAYNKSNDGNTSVLRSKLLGVGYLDPSNDNEYVILQNVLDSTYSLDGNTVTYDNVFTGTDARWSYQTSKLKEEIIMSNQTRTVLENNPPSDFNLSNQHSYLVFITKLDYKELNVWNGTQQQLGNFSTDGDITFKDVLGEVKFALPMGIAHEVHNKTNRSKLKYRLLQYNDNNYLLSGLKVTTLNNMCFPVVVDPSNEIEVSDYDGYIEYQDLGGDWDTCHDSDTGQIYNTTALGTGYLVSPGYAMIKRTYLFFDTSGLVGTITSACLSLKTHSKHGSSFSYVLQTSKNSTFPHMPLQTNDYNRLHVAPGTNGTFDWKDNTNGVRFNMTINASGFSWINKIGWTRFIIRATNDTLDHEPPSDCYIYFHSASADVPHRPRLFVNYSEASGSAVTNASTSVEETSCTLNGYVENGGGAVQCGWWVNSTTEGHNVSAGEGDANTTFSASDTNLSAGTYYTVRAWVYNSSIPVFSNASNTVAFHTKPQAPTSLAAPYSAYNTVDLTWTKGAGAGTTVVVRNGTNWGYFPKVPSNGTIVYNGTGDSYTDTVTGNTTYNYSVWSCFGDKRSDANDTETVCTPPGIVRGFTANISGANIILNWKHGYGTNKTLIRRKANSFPTSPTDATLVFNGSAQTVIDTLDYTQYYTAWAYGANDAEYHFSASLNLSYGGLSINCYDEEDNASLRFDVFIANENGTQSYISRNNSNTLKINVNATPHGSKTSIRVSPAEYLSNTSDNFTTTLAANQSTMYYVLNHTPDSKEEAVVNAYNTANPAWGEWNPPFDVIEDTVIIYADTSKAYNKINVSYNHTLYRNRFFVMDLGVNFAYTINAYLPKTTKANLYRINVVNEVDQPINDVLVTIKKHIFDGFKTITTIYTDGQGDFEIYLISGDLYKFNLTHDDYQDQDSDYNAVLISPFTNTFTMLLPGTEPEESELPTEMITFNGYINNTDYLILNFTDALGGVINTNIRVYEINLSTGIEWLNQTWSYTTNSDYQVNLKVNRTNTFRIVLHMNHSRWGYQKQTLILGTNYTALTTQTDADTAFDIFGTNPIGWSNFFMWLFLIAGCVYADNKDAGIIMILLGGLFLFINFFIGFNTVLETFAGGIIPVLFIVVGILIMWNDSRKKVVG